MSERANRISIGRVIRDSMTFNPQNWGKKGFTADSIPAAVSDLLEMLQKKKIDHVLVGGIALLSYINGRNTSDLDLIVAVSSLNDITDIVIKEKEKYFARGEFHGLQLDFLFTENPLFKLVSEHYSEVRDFLEKPLKTASVEGLLLLKLYALPSLYRQGDFSRVGIYENDVAVLIEQFSPKEGPLLRDLAGFLDPSDLGEVVNILNEIHGRIDRFNSTKNK